MRGNFLYSSKLFSLSKKTAAVFCIALFSLALALPSHAQDLNVEGKWTLENVELYQYSDNDSIKINKEYLPVNSTSGVFETILFNAKTCKVDVSSNQVECPYRIEGSSITIYATSIPFVYNIIESNNQLILFRKYSFRNESQNNISQGVKLTYSK